MIARGWTHPPAVEGDDDEEEEDEDGATGGRSARFLQLLEGREFSVVLPPKPPEKIVLLDACVICTAGNLSNIQALPKDGKSAVVGAIIASAMPTRAVEPDTLGFMTNNTKEKAILHFDTEQSPFDHHQLVERALARVHLTDPPVWFDSYCLTDLDVRERLGCVLARIEQAGDSRRGVTLVIIDGVADLCVDPNDPREAFGLVQKLHKMAIANQCAILTVLHENPGSDSGKMRGHLGSQLERKVETPLRLKKDPATGITTIWADRARHCHIPKSQGKCFKWSDQAKMHVSCGIASEVKAQESSAKFADEAAAAFGDAQALSYTNLTNGISKSTGVKKDAAKKRIKAYTEIDVVFKGEDGLYRLAGIPAAQVDTAGSAADIHEAGAEGDQGAPRSPVPQSGV